METVLGFVRHALTFGGGFLVTNGAISAGSLDLAVGAVITLAGIVWSALAKSPKNAII